MFIIEILILLVAIVVHELAHGYVADRLGDPTARQKGRLTLNPIAHMDIYGSVLVPGLLLMSGSSMLFGWAKPVPVNMAKMRRPFRDMMLVALAGPASNILMACGASVVFHLLSPISGENAVLYICAYTLAISVQINLILAIFNMVPIPPLDGSRVLMYFLPDRYKSLWMRAESYGFVLVLGLAYFGFFRWILGFVLPPVLGKLV
jgi:Zn-dependent protease